jgi:hypothetical protein
MFNIDISSARQAFPVPYGARSRKIQDFADEKRNVEGIYKFLGAGGRHRGEE